MQPRLPVQVGQSAVVQQRSWLVLPKAQGSTQLALELELLQLRLQWQSELE